MVYIYTYNSSSSSVTYVFNLPKCKCFEFFMCYPSMAVFCRISSTSEDWGVKKGTKISRTFGFHDVMGKDSLREMVLHMEWCTLPKTTSELKPLIFKKGQGPHLGKFHLKQPLILRGGCLLVSGEGISLGYLSLHNPSTDLHPLSTCLLENFLTFNLLVIKVKGKKHKIPLNLAQRIIFHQDFRKIRRYLFLNF